MNKLWLILLSVGMMVESSQAQEVEENMPKAESVIQEATLNKDEINSVAERKPEAEVVHKIENKVVSLPPCNDKKLYENNIEFIRDYFDKVADISTLQRRRRHFIINNLANFDEENIANYQTSATSPVSDYIAEVKVNNGLTDENLRLCKNTSKDMFAKDLYLLIYPENEGYRVQVINLMPSLEKYEKLSFEYKE